LVGDLHRLLDSEQEESLVAVKRGNFKSRSRLQNDGQPHYRRLLGELRTVCLTNAPIIFRRVRFLKSMVCDFYFNLLHARQAHLTFSDSPRCRFTVASLA
jgi:hypothetical protein